MPPLNLNETDDIARKLSDVETDYSQGDLTKKGYCKKKWELLKGVATNSQIKEVEKLQCRLQIDLEEDVYFEKMLAIIKAVASSKGISDETKTNGDYDSDADETSNNETQQTDEPKPTETDNGDSISTEIKEKDEGDSKSSVDNDDSKNLETSSKSKERASSKAKEDTKEVDNENSNKSEDKTRENVKTSSRGRKTTLKRSMKEEALTDEEEEVAELLLDRDSSPEWNPSKSNGMPTVKPSSKSRFSLSTKRTKVQEIKPFLVEVEKEVKTEESSRSAGDSGMEDGSQSAEEDDEGPKKKKSKSSKATDSTKGTIAGLKTNKKTVSRCDTCLQILDDDDLKLYQGHPHNAVEEFVALTDPKLSLFTGEENDVHLDDQRPTNKITHFSVYDKEGHLCPIDSGLIERNVLLYFSGYLKPVYEEDTSPEGGVPTKDIGPINEWWVSGYDGGEKALMGFSTAFAEYYMLEPSEEYAPLMNGIKEKIYMGKLVIEFLIDEVNPSYEDLINKIQTSLPPPGMERLTEDSLLKHSQFVCDQVVSFDAASDHVDDTPLIATQCMRALVHYAGITFGKRQVMRREEKKQFKDKKKVEWTKATTTPLVKNIFETFFTEQLDENDVNLTMRRKRCGVCEVCQLPDCGTCPNCLNMVKFGGNGKSKQACIKRKCPNMAVADADDSDPEDEEAYQEAAELKGKNGLVFMRSRQCASGKKPVTWVGEPVVDDGKRVFYEEAMVGEMEIKRGDYVSVEPANLTSPVVIGQVAAMWQNQLGQRFMHAIWFCRSSETVLGETGDPHELFVVDECENSLLSGITAKVQVQYKPASSTWKTDGGVKVENEKLPENSFFYRLRYNEQFGRFEEVEPDPPCRNKATEHRFCASCERQYLAQKFETPMVDEKLDEVGPKNEIMFGVVKWKGEEYRPGTCVYLEPTTFKFNTYGLVFTPANRKSDTVDEDLYPEFYRKGSEYVKGSNEETPTPFCVGLITAIVTNSKDKIIAPSDICIKVVKFYRPENTVGITTQYHQLDLNLLYSSDEEKIVNFHDVTGKCTIVYRENLIEDVYSWTRAGPHRFYFTEAYDKQSKQTVEPTKLVKQLGDMGKGGGKGKGKGKKVERRRAEPPPEWNKVSQPLRCLDVFAGCGGLSEGLHQANIAETLWAIEKEEPAANAFKMNNPKATVFTEDCNALLKLVLNGDTKTEKGQKLPQKGEVEMLVGGPPCQGFSGMNRFNSRQYSLFKNSLIVSYLSYCDYYRPRFFILENVRNFVSFKSSMVLKLTLHTLIKMGYQVTFGVLQAGNYGVPQTRRRAIIMAAAPGEILPNFPEPSHVFNLRACQLSVMVGDKKFVSNCQWLSSAPYRTITVRDAMSDLPEIKNGANKDEISYNGDPLSHFQKMMRFGQDGVMLRDHICKEMAPVVEARMAHIPTASGSDWRDLPNICVKLAENNYTKKLQYTHHDKKNGKSSTGALRGVCACASGKTCDPMDRQFNTLIPWCLPHTGNRHNHWAGLYGRLEWEGFFSTTVTNPEPMGKQGRVLHPEQTRVVSVRECARSQGFPDKYRFYGTILHKHRQIGNAVPPPMGAAIGREIARSVSLYEKKQSEESSETEVKEELKQELKTEPMSTD